MRLIHDSWPGRLFVAALQCDRLVRDSADKLGQAFVAAANRCFRVSRDAEPAHWIPKLRERGRKIAEGILEKSE